MGVTIARPRIPNHVRHSAAPDRHREPRCNSSRVTAPTRVEQDSTQLLRLTPRHGTSSLAEVAYRLVGPVDAPVVVVQGGISANRAAGTLSNVPQPTPWWPQVVGDGLAIDTARVRVLSLEWLTPADYTSADTDETAQPPRAVTTDDQADALAALLSKLGIERIAAYVGSSYGGMVALAFAARYPSLIGRLVVISAAHRAHPC
ncbi:MAG: alpha/beta fold hydrolase, partial [Mycobacteriales bacterium]